MQIWQKLQRSNDRTYTLHDAAKLANKILKKNNSLDLIFSANTIPSCSK